MAGVAGKSRSLTEQLCSCARSQEALATLATLASVELGARRRIRHPKTSTDCEALIVSRAHPPRVVVRSVGRFPMQHHSRLPCVANRCRPSTFTPQNLPKRQLSRLALQDNILKSLALPRGSNPCFRRERATSWAARRREQAERLGKYPRSRGAQAAACRRRRSRLDRRTLSRPAGLSVLRSKVRIRPRRRPRG